MPKDTKHRSFRLSTKAVALIEQMAEAEACSHTAIVERAVRMLDIALNGPTRDARRPTPAPDAPDA